MFDLKKARHDQTIYLNVWSLSQHYITLSQVAPKGISNVFAVMIEQLPAGDGLALCIRRHSPEVVEFEIKRNQTQLCSSPVIAALSVLVCLMVCMATYFPHNFVFVLHLS
jgi:hypothetical protein